MAAQETYRIEPMTRYALTTIPYIDAKPSDIAIFQHREAADKALNQAYRTAELGEQFNIVSVKRYVLQFVRTVSVDPHWSNGDDPNATKSIYRHLAEFPRLDDAEKVRDALNATITFQAKAAGLNEEAYSKAFKAMEATKAQLTAGSIKATFDNNRCS